MAPWPTVQNGVIEYFKERGGKLPDFFVNETLKGITPELRGRVLTSLRALKLLDGAGRTQSFFQTLVDARGTGQWQVQLRVLMNTAYPYLTYVNLSQADSAALRAAFVAYTKKDTENLSKAEVFYLNLARAAGVRLSDGLQKRVTVSEAMAAVKAARKAEKTPVTEDKSVNPELKATLTEQQRADKIMEVLRMFDGEDLPAEPLHAILTLLDYVKKKAAA